MTMLRRIENYLGDHHMSYVHTVHRNALTARDVAHNEHISEHKVAKTVVFHGDNGYGIAVLPASALVDLQELRVLLGLTHVRLATEAELARLFPESELGAMPPFGNLFGLPVYLDSSLCNEDMIAFSAGTHRDAIHIRLRDFERLERPVVVPFAF